MKKIGLILSATVFFGYAGENKKYLTLSGSPQSVTSLILKLLPQELTQSGDSPRRYSPRRDSPSNFIETPFNIGDSTNSLASDSGGSPFGLNRKTLRGKYIPDEQRCCVVSSDNDFANNDFAKSPLTDRESSDSLPSVPVSPGLNDFDDQGPFFLEPGTTLPSNSALPSLRVTAACPSTPSTPRS